jgi:hypothetical protein
MSWLQKLKQESQCATTIEPSGHVQAHIGGGSGGFGGFPAITLETPKVIAAHTHSPVTNREAFLIGLLLDWCTPAVLTLSRRRRQRACSGAEGERQSLHRPSPSNLA